MSSADQMQDPEEEEKEEEETITRSGGPVQSVEGWVVFVTGLHEETQEADVTDWFEGNVNVTRINFDRSTGHCKGYALVEFDKRTEAQDAINKLHGTDLLGKTIGVHWAFVRPSASSRPRSS